MYKKIQKIHTMNAGTGGSSQIDLEISIKTRKNIKVYYLDHYFGAHFPLAEIVFALWEDFGFYGH